MKIRKNELEKFAQDMLFEDGFYYWEYGGFNRFLTTIYKGKQNETW